ncbi:MAG: serine protease [Rhodobacter sp.]|nr:serine protease [Rhodobacter sp.]
MGHIFANPARVGCIAATMAATTLTVAPSGSLAQSRIDDARSEPRIINGQEVLAGQGPWAASLRFQVAPTDASSTRHICGGSFVSPLLSDDKERVEDWISDDPNPEWIVTAAHCVVDRSGNLEDKDRLTVFGGARNRTNPDGRGQVQQVVEIIPHPQFDVETLENDIALLRLSPPVANSLPATRRASIRFPAPRDTNWINEPYMSVYAQGWGTTETGSDSLLLKEVQLPVVDRTLCQRKFSIHGEIIGIGMLCAGFVDGNFDSCQGDSGGPLVYRAEGNIAIPRSPEPVLVGVVSWGIGCGRADLFGVYTTASVYRKWAEEAVVAEIGVE